MFGLTIITTKRLKALMIEMESRYDSSLTATDAGRARENMYRLTLDSVWHEK